MDDLWYDQLEALFSEHLNERICAREGWYRVLAPSKGPHRKWCSDRCCASASAQVVSARIRSRLSWRKKQAADEARQLEQLMEHLHDIASPSGTGTDTGPD